LLEELLDATLELELDLLELELDLDELLDATLEDDDELVAAGPTEHQALLVKLLAGNSDVAQVKLPVSVAYTNEPDLPRATLCVPLMVQAPPTWAHLV
jgi:hypothetical protein